MKHPFSETIANLKWLEQQDFPSEIWEKHFIPLVDKLNITIDKFKFMIIQSEGVKDEKLD